MTGRALLSVAVAAELVICCGETDSTSVAGNKTPTSGALTAAPAATTTSMPQAPMATSGQDFGPGECPKPAGGVTFPADFPVYPKAELQEDRTCTGFSNPILWGAVDLYRRWSTTDSGQQVVDFYVPQLNRGNWILDKAYPQQTDGSAGATFTSRTDSKSNLDVAYTKVGPGGMIEVWIWLSYSPRPSSTPSTATGASLCGAPSNPWNYTFCGGNLISSPPSDFCLYFKCIGNFSDGVGYLVQCVDESFSKSGGRNGVCSYHGGFRRNLYSP